jgi:hypothetical protein
MRNLTLKFSEHLRRKVCGVLPLTIGILGACYIVSFTSSKFVPFTAWASIYARQASAFLNGQTHMRQPTPASLREAENPYKPYLASRNEWDLSYYNGKLYSYFGVAPVFALYLPAYLLSFKTWMINDATAALIFCLVWMIFLVLILFEIRTRFFPKISNLEFYAAALVTCLCNASLVLLVRPKIYEVAISSALTFFFAAVYFLLRELFNSRAIRDKRIALSSLFLGLTVASRASNIWICLIVLVMSAIYLRRRHLAALLIPFSLCVGMLLIYNFIRFDSFFEFGWHYQLTILDQRQLSLFSLDRLPAGLQLSLLESPHLMDRYPFLDFTFRPTIDLPRPYFTEFPIGFLPTTPFVLTLLFLCRKKTRRALPAKVKWILFGCFICGMINLIQIAGFASAIARYRADFASFFLLAACIVWFAWQSTARDSKRISFASMMVFLLIAWSLWVNVLFISNELFRDGKVWSLINDRSLTQHQPGSASF